MDRLAFPCLAALALVLLPGCGGGGGSAPGPFERVVPLADIMGNKPKAPEPSPDGRRVASLQPGAGPGRRMNLFVGPPGGPAIQVTHVEDRDLTQFHWLDEGRLAFFREPEGDERKRLWVVNADGRGARELTPPDLPRATSALVGQEPGGTGFWRVAMGDYTRQDLYRIHPGTGECHLMDRAPEFTCGYATDLAGQVLLAATLDGKGMTLLHRTREDEPFRNLRSTSLPDFIYPLRVAYGSRHALVCTNLEHEYAVIRSINLEDGTLGRILHEVPGRDVDHPLEGALSPFSEGWPGGLPPMRFEAAAMPDASDAVTYEFLTYPARDGLAIPAHLYLPKSRGLGRWPAVVLCHGGPTARWNPNDPWAYLLASRGLAVLCPDFRGSTGYGKSFTAKGFGQWGRAMQDDLTDAARWLVQAGHAREDRIGIVGASYGGYAALAGAAFTPDVFRCAVAFAAVSNLLTFIDSCWTPVQANFMRLSIGDPVAQLCELAERSPALHADRIRIPLLIAHGGRDVRVSPAQSEEMVQALRSRGVAVPYLTYPEEGHGFSKEENTLHFFRTLENFLGLHLGSKVEAPSPVRLTP